MDLKALISQMTLKEKLGQLGQYNASVFCASDAKITGPVTKLEITDDDVNNMGSVLNFKNAAEFIKIQKSHLEKDRNKIPLLSMMDVIHGYRTIYPIPLALGCSFDTELVKECSEMAAKEASASGIHATFAPMVDHVRDARWGRVMETCSEDQLVNSVMGAAQIEGYQGDDLSNPDNIGTCVKHLAGYGAAESGKDYNSVDISEHILRECYLPAYKACIDAGSKMVMTAFNSLSGIPAIANKWLMNTLLRDEWNFDGLVISDYNAVCELIKHGVAKDKKEAAKLAFECGCDIEMASTAYYHNLEELINQGVFTMEQLDRVVLKILTYKKELGLFDDPYRGASSEKEERVCLCPKHRAIAKKAAEKSAVLLKNNGILPFSKTVKNIAVIGPFADNGSILGWWNCHGSKDDAITVKEGIENLLLHANITVVKGCSEIWDDFDDSGFEEAVTTAKNADIVVLCLGESHEYSGEGNCRADLDLPGVQNELAKAVIDANPNTAVLLFNGRPLSITKLDKIAPAILDMWFPGTEGGSAAASLLFGDANPQGKLSITFPKTVGQCPIYYNHPSTARPKNPAKDDIRAIHRSSYVDCGNLPLYSFGHGLSYSNFLYEDMALSKDKITKEQALQVTVKIRNDSDKTGTETVGLYMRDIVATTVRPVAQLIAFEKVEFLPNECKEVTFTVTEKMLRYWNCENEFVSDAGEFELMTGYPDHFVFAEKFELI